ncbi:MAG: leucine-rich repeat protein [Clostridia bacterium]|nr:leucine-rich repeat protein [Clostridia bacterium]
MDIEGTYYCSRCMKQMEEDGACPHCGYDAAQSEKNASHLDSGTLLHDRYQLGAVIGAGGFGVTYAAWDHNLQIPVAVKEYFPARFAYRNTADSDDIRAYETLETVYQLGLNRFRQEAQVLAQFRNLSGVVQVNEYFEENNTCYIAMEYVHGVALDEYVKENHPDAKTLIGMMKQVIDSLEIIHRQGIHHRDIKPENLLVQEDGSIKLIDFGSAREIEHVTNLIVVSDGYAPVEQYDLQQVQGPWSDIYSLCATMYHMLTDEMPPVSIGRVKVDTLKRPSALGVRLRKHEENALMAGLVVEPKKRVHSIEEFRSMLYNMPLPQEAQRRRALLRRVYAAFASMLLIAAAAVVNFAGGFPLGEGLMYTLHADGWHVVSAKKQQAVVDIPGRLLGIPVSGIASGVFDAECGAQHVKVPGTVRRLGGMTFAECPELSTVTLENGVEQIGAYAFAGCAKLHTVNVPPSVTEMADTAFAGAWERMMLCGEKGSYAQAFALETQTGFYDRRDYAYEHVGGRVRFPKGSCVSADGQADADGYEYAEVETGVRLQRTAQYDAAEAAQERFTVPSYIDGHPVVLLDDEFEFPGECEEIVLPVSLQYLARGAFDDCGYGLTQVDFGAKLKNVPDGMFWDRQAINDVVLPDTVEIIGGSAFWNVPLRRINLPASLRHIGDSAFYRTQLNEVDFPEGLETIGDSAFCDTALYEAEFPQSLRSIGDDAFAFTNILTLDLTIDLDRLGEGAFSYGSELREAAIHAVDSDPAHPSVGVLPAGCFEGCEFLYQATLTGAVRAIAPYAFASIETGATRVSLPEGLTVIGEKAFAGFDGDVVIIPDSVVSIHETAFDDSSVKILGSAGSYAQAYAQAHGIEFCDYLQDAKAENGGRIPAAGEIVLK